MESESVKPLILAECESGPLLQIAYAPILQISIESIRENLLMEYKEKVIDIDRVSDRVDELCDLVDAFLANENEPKIIDTRMFTPAKKRPAKRQAEESRSRPRPKPRSKKLKEDNKSSIAIQLSASGESSIPTRVLRSRTVQNSGSASSINSTGNTVIEVSGYSTFNKKPRGNTVKSEPTNSTTPNRRILQNTPLRNNKKTDGNVKLTPLQKKAKLLEEKRMELLQKIEEKDRRAEKNMAEKRKRDILKKAQAELNKTPRLRTPIASKQMPKMNLNITPLSSAQSSMSSLRGNNTKVSSTSTIVKPIVKKETAPIKDVKPAAAKVDKTTIPAAKPKKIPEVERHFDMNCHQHPSGAEASYKDSMSIRQLELSPICIDKDMPNKLVDIISLKDVDHFETSTDLHEQYIASTFLQESLPLNASNHPNLNNLPNTPKINHTFKVDETKENDYEITHYMSQSLVDHEQKYRNGKLVPKWARGSQFKAAIEKQFSDNYENPVDWREMLLFLPDEAFKGFKTDPKLMKRLENRDESIVWNVENL